MSVDPDYYWETLKIDHRLQNSSKKTVIIICGPTAVGKTSVAIKLAKHFKTEIISADSRQCFKELNIGVARPSENELKEVPHHFIATHSVKDDINAAWFEKYALQKTEELFKKHDTVIMVGGTGLYIRAFCEGMDEIPELKPEVRDQIVEKYKQFGLSWLQEEVKKKDTAFYTIGEIQNPQRMMRALEVMETTGQSILSFRNGEKAQRDFNILKIGLELPKEELHRNINARLDKMMEAGLLDEVKQLLPFKNLNALQTVGYKELVDYFIPRPRLENLNEQEFTILDNVAELDKAIELIKKNTRQYAKRQMTWFRKDKEIKWFSPAQIDEIISYCRGQISGESFS